MAIDRPTHVVLKPKKQPLAQRSNGADGSPPTPPSAAQSPSESSAQDSLEPPLVLLDDALELAPSDRERTMDQTTKKRKQTEGSFFEKKKSMAVQPVTPKTPETQPNFIIAYDGAFVGNYRAPLRTTGRAALQVVAHRLREKLGTKFDLDKLELFRPVPVRIDREKIAKDFAEGSFEWFS